LGREFKRSHNQASWEFDTPEMARLRSSGGAAWAFWQEATVNELYYRLLQTFAGIVRDDKIPVEIVHKAFLSIPEYVITLPPCKEQQELEDSEIEFEMPEGFSQGYPF
jgi:hypothetical protein